MHTPQILDGTRLYYPSLGLALLSQIVNTYGKDIFSKQKISLFVLDDTLLIYPGLGLALLSHRRDIKKSIFHLKTQYRQLSMLETGKQTGTYFSLTVVTVRFTRHPLIYPGLGLAPSDVLQSKNHHYSG